MKREILDDSYLSRYDLTNRNYNKLKSDYLSFEHIIIEKLPKKFINRIMRNFLNFERDENRQKQYDDEVTEFLKNFERRSQESLIERDRITLSKKVIDEFKKFDFSEDKTFNKRMVIDKILADYCDLEYSTREKIYYYDNFLEIQEAVVNQWYLKVNVGNNKILYKPYSLEIDDNSYSYYISGYSKSENQENYKIHATKLCNIRSCNAKRGDCFQFTREEEKEINYRLTYSGIAYINCKVEHFKVWLTDEGYFHLFCNTIRHQRPFPIHSHNEVYDDQGNLYFELEFDCSYIQIRNYFFSFGKNAIIVEPTDKKGMLKEDYEDALNNYMP